MLHADRLARAERLGAPDGPRGTPDDERRTAVDAAVDRAVGLGATLVRVAEERGERWAVMQDPEGNELCLQ
jgi:hypothetical protein